MAGSNRRVVLSGGALKGEAMIDSDAIDGLLENAVAGGALPGVIAVAGDRDGTLYEGAFGRLRVDGEAPVQLDTVFALASMTKALASVAALQLIERGRDGARAAGRRRPSRLSAACRCSRALTVMRRGCARPAARPRSASC